MIVLLIAGILVFALIIGVCMAAWIREERRYAAYARDIHQDIIAEKNTQVSALIDVQSLLAARKGNGHGNRLPRGHAGALNKFRAIRPR